MKQIHKQALLITTFIIFVIVGTILALFPRWELFKEHKVQEDLLLRLEKQGNTKPNNRKNLLLENINEYLSNTAFNIDNKFDRKGIVTDETIAKTPMPEAGTEIGILIIPKINARLPVTAGVTEEQLKISEGWVMQTASIGSKGNAVIAGHRSYTWGNHFNRLEELEIGDEIFYTGLDNNTLHFVVHEVLIVNPDDPAVFSSPSAGMAQLTLYTCTPIRIATHRLIVRALLEE